MSGTRGIRMLVTLAVLLVAVVAASEWATVALGAQQRGSDPDIEIQLEIAAEDKLLDRIGATRTGAVLDWLADVDLNARDVTDDTPVWLSHHGDGSHYHSTPLCGGMKSPLKVALREAIARGYGPCWRCWETVSN